MQLNAKKQKYYLSTFAVLLLSACGGGNNDYTIGGTVTGLTGIGGPQSVVLQDNGGDTLTVSANGPFTFPTTVTSNGTTIAAYNVTVLTQPIGEICTVSGGSGTANGNVTTVQVTCSGSSTSNYAYVVDAGGTVLQYTIGANGALTTLVTSVAAGTTPYAISVVQGLYAYVVNNGSGNVSEYTIGSGVITPNANASAIASGSGPFSVTADPSGHYLYVVNSGTNPGTVSQYTINTNGTLTALGAPIQTGTTPYSIAVDPVGPYAYVANYGDGTLSEYNINSGVLSLTATLPAPPAGNNHPASVAVDSSGSYVYVANYSSATVSQYSIGANGVLTALPAGPVAAGSNPISVAVDPSGTHVYVANYSSGASTGSVSEYSIGTGGALSLINTVATGKNPTSVTIDQSGQYAYVTNLGDGTVSQYTISSGLLTADTTATVTVGGQPIAAVSAQ